MTKDLILYYLVNDSGFQEDESDLLSVNQDGLIVSNKQLPEVLFVTSFPPRECGIATYTKDLVDALNDQFENSFECTICALESETEQHVYSQAPKFILNTDQRYAFPRMALKISEDKDIELVVIQHEFGFFASKEREFKQLYDTISKPIVFVFHTVLPRPNNELKVNVQDMAAKASLIIVMTENAVAILINDYDVSAYKIKIIPHGTHLVPPLDRRKVKNRYQLSNRKVLSTFGLLGSSKSIETTLEAMPAVIEAHPEVLFLVLGKTHPSVVKHDGEQYRHMLEQMVIALNLENHVRFINEYLPLPTLLEYLQLSDIYLFTSRDPNQAVSGTFSYALSSGCPVISTPIPHAKEVLSNNNGIIIDFENSEQLSKAIISLLDDDKLRAEISSNSFHIMASTAWQNSAIAHGLLFEKFAQNSFQLKYKVPEINLEHIKKMTTSIGILQFSKISLPDRQSGYTLDDNARALIAICQHYELFPVFDDLVLLNTYLQFINYCFQPNGLFLNYVNERREYADQNYIENLEDSNGRAIWALGYVCSLKGILPIHLLSEAENLLEMALPHLDQIYSTRAMAFIIKGLHYQDKTENLALIETFANRLVQMYKHEKMNDWHWFENYLTYGNSLLPEAMLCAYLSTQKEEYKTVAKESFDFLLSKILVDGKIKVISNKGWHIKDSSNEAMVGGEQPIDVAYTILALEKFYLVFKNEEYRREAYTAFNWFLGDNHLHQIVYNPCTGGCYDGVEEYNVNLNQGAESTLSYLMGRLAIERLGQLDMISNNGLQSSQTKKKASIKWVPLPI